MCCPGSGPEVTERRFQTLQQMFNELNRHSSVKSASSKQRQPVVLLLGGGMAAGKSTVREIIGQDDFWTKVQNQLGKLSLWASSACEHLCHSHSPVLLSMIRRAGALQPSCVSCRHETGWASHHAKGDACVLCSGGQGRRGD